MADQESIDQLKIIWAKYGVLLVAGVLGGALLIAGWQYWQYGQRQAAEQNATHYNSYLNAVANNDTETAQRHLDALKADAPGSSYAVIAAMSSAAVSVSNGDLIDAEQQLRWAIDTKIDTLKALASFRLARILYAQGRYPDALSQLSGYFPESYQSLIAELRGDIFYAQGDSAAAKDAYEQAKELQSNVDQNHLQIKLDDLSSGQ